jgi:uncharacterized membrane protein
VAAIGLRAYALTTKSLWFDETYSVFVASLPVERLLVVTAINDAHPPLYYVLLNVWTAFVGTGEAAVRALSLLIGAAAVPVVWGFGRHLVGQNAALVAAGLVALAPGQVAAGQEARMYGLLTLTALLSWWALWTAARPSAGRGPWVGYSLAVAAMLYAHYYGFFVVASQAVYLLWVRPPLTVWKRWVTSGLVVVALLLPWIPALLGQVASGRAWPTFRPPLRPVLLADTMASLVLGRPIFDPMGVDPLHPTAIWALAAAGTVVLAAGVRACRATGRGEALALLLSASVVPLVLAFGVSFKVHVFAPRYLTFALPGLALLTGAALAVQPSRRSAAAMRPLAVAACLVVLGVNAAALARFYRQPRLDVFDWRRVSATLAAAAQPTDAIAFLPGFARIPVNYYFPGPQPRLALDPRTLDPEGPQGPRMSLLVATLADRPRVWIVTVPPIPTSVDTLITALGRRSYGVTQRRDVNMARLILLERGRRR